MNALDFDSEDCTVTFAKEIGEKIAQNLYHKQGISYSDIKNAICQAIMSKVKKENISITKLV